jgi:lambda family phage portal protein
MVAFFDKLLSRGAPSAPPPPTIKFEDLPDYNLMAGLAGIAPAYQANFDGDKFPGGFGATKLYATDYWTLRERSSQLFKDNLYAKGLINRLVTNEINTGLSPEARPSEAVLGLAQGSLRAWTDVIETRFAIWGKMPDLCDGLGVATFGAIQRQARLEALVAGDVLVVIEQSAVTKLPMVRLVDGSRVVSPLFDQVDLKNGHYIEQGIEFDAGGRRVAYWVKQADGTMKRIPARGETTGRTNAFMVYGSMRRVFEVRGEPLLATVLQSLREIDRYRDSTQRKAVINSILAMFIKKSVQAPGSLPTQGGAVRKGAVTVEDADGGSRKLEIANQLPGVVYQELQAGEEPVLKGGEGTDINFGTFEEAIVQAIAWTNEIPPEILRLAFSNNYSASQAAINEFKIYLNKIWADFGETFCTPIYIEWLLSEALLRKWDGSALLASWRDPERYDIFGSLTTVEWYGNIKPSTDMLKMAKASEMLVNHGWSTNAREARGLTGTKYSQNIEILREENEQLARAQEPLAIFKQKYGSSVEQVEENEGLDSDADADALHLEADERAP